MPATPHTDQDEERAQRHLGICARLIELGMQIAEAAATHILQDLAAQAETTAPEPATNQNPSAPRRPDPGLLFSRMARALRQTIALEARIAADHKAALAGHAPAFPPGPDLRGPILGKTAATQPIRTQSRHTPEERLETELYLDPYGETPIADILEKICHDYGLRPDFTAMPREIREALAPDAG